MCWVTIQGWAGGWAGLGLGSGLGWVLFSILIHHSQLPNKPYLSRPPPPPPQARPLALANGGGGAAGGIIHKTRNHKNDRGGRIAHNTRNHRAPSPFPSPSTQMTFDVLFPVWLVGGTCSYVAVGFGTACSLLYLVENRAWLVMFFRLLYRPLSFQDKFRLGSLKVSLSTWLNDFHSGLLSKGPEESADGDHDHHLRHHHRQNNVHHYHWLWR